MERKEFNLKEYQKITDPVELKKSMFIEASAGTGKTYNITFLPDEILLEKVIYDAEVKTASEIVECDI